MFIKSVMPSNHLILCCPLLPPSIFPSIRVFSNESILHIRWPKYWSSASASVLPMNIQDWFPLGLTSWISLKTTGLSRVFSNTTVQRSINSSVLSFHYGPTLTYIRDCWKAIALTRQTFVGKVMCLLVNMLFRLVIAFLPRRRCLWISWLHSPFAVIFHCFPTYLPWSDGTGCHDLRFMNVEF